MTTPTNAQARDAESKRSDMPPRPRKSGVSGLNRVTRKLADGTKKVYFYHIATGARIEHLPTSAAGLAQITKLDAKAARADLAVTSLADVIEQFKAKNPKWTGATKRKPYADNTKRMFQVDFDALEAGAADLYPDHMTIADIQDLVDIAAETRGGRAAQLLLSHLGTLFGWAVKAKGDDGKPLIRRNPMTPRNDNEALVKPDPPARKTKANRRWRAHEVRGMFEAAAHEPGLLALYALCYYAGLRVGDARAVEWRHLIREGNTLTLIVESQEKNEGRLEIEVSGALAVIIDATPRRCETIAHSSLGKPWTKSGADQAMIRLRQRMKKAKAIDDGLTFHGLRRTLASSARDAGASNAGIKGAIGDKSGRMADLYADEADTITLGNEVRVALMDKDAAWMAAVVRGREMPAGQ